MDEVICCPYNASHMILKRRMAAHLIKCRQQHWSDKYSTCPFNSTHVVQTQEFEYHVENCSDRKKLDSFLYATNEPVPKDESAFNIELPPTSENWDEEASASSYLDVKKKVVENQPVFRIPVGMSKAEKKAFFKQEVERFENIANGKGASQNDSKAFSLSGLRNNTRETEDFAIYLESRGNIKGKPDNDFQVVERHHSIGRGIKKL